MISINLQPPVEDKGFTVCYYICHAIFEPGIRSFFVEKDCDGSICDQAPVFHGSVRLENSR